MSHFDIFGLWTPVLFAPFVGSFLGVLIRRLPAGRSVAWSRSACEACGATLGARDLVPIASFLVLRGRCRHCQAPIPRAHLTIEIAAALIPLAALAAGLRDTPLVWSACALGWPLLALAWIDAATFLLPDALTLPLVVAGLAQCALIAPDQLTNRALGAATAYLALRGLARAYRALRHRDGLGAGDAKLLAAGGAWLGLTALPAVLLLAAVAGLAFAGAIRLRGGAITLATRIPFGPALAGAIWITFLAINR